MAPPSVITETDNMSTTLTNSSSSSPLSASHGSTQTSVTNSPLLQNHPYQYHHQHQQQQQESPPPLNNQEEASGWPRIAKLMTDTPSFESYARFRELNVKNLLYYQVELSMLQEELTKLEKRDRDRRGHDSSDFAKLAVNMVASPKMCTMQKDKQQWEKALEVRRLLKQYNAAVLQHVQMSALPDPDSSNVEELRKWIRRADLGNFCIAGLGSDAWGKLEDPVKPRKRLLPQVVQMLRSIFWPERVPKSGLDLVSTLPHRNMDGFTRWVHKEWIPVYHAWDDPPPPTNPDDPEKLSQSPQEKEKNEHPDLREYSGAAIVRFTSRVATVFACILPTLAIGILTTAHSTLHTLLYIGGFTALFSIGLMILTPPDTTRVEIFTATAAFSAVLVVFVQNQ